MSNTKGVAFAFLLGGAIGAGLALILAPASGTETRKKLKDGIDDAGDWAKDTYQDARGKVSESTGKVKAFVSEKREDLHSAFEAGKEAYSRGKERLSGES
ncbi:MAG: YtxH domain-containing protein [Deltaproteobacteria bacterium]|nr:YtxH domain-containing protein [Deltaproteobacteria bacterium]